MSAFIISIISCSLELQSSHWGRKLHYSSFRKCESCFLIICMCSIIQSFLSFQGKKLQSSSSHLNRHPIVSLIVIPSSRSAKKTLLVLPCVSLLVTSLNLIELLLTPFLYLAIVVITGRMQPKRTSKEPIPSSSCQRGSSSSSVHLVLLWYLCFC